MKTSTKFWIITVVCAVVSFMLSRVIWPDVAGMPMPTTAQIPLFMFISAIESLSFGVGVAFALLGWKYMSEMAPEKKGKIWPFLAIIWLLVSWWPHDNMHRVNPMGDFSGLLRIEYTFHLTLVVAGLIVAYNFWKFISRPKVP